MVKLREKATPNFDPEPFKIIENLSEKFARPLAKA